MMVDEKTMDCMKIVARPVGDYNSRQKGRNRTGIAGVSGKTAPAFMSRFHKLIAYRRSENRRRRHRGLWVT